MEESKNTFTGYLGSDFQLKLLWQLVTEEEFCDKILPLLEIDYFDHPEYKRYYLVLDRYYQEFKKSPSILNGSVDLAIAKFSNSKNETEAELLKAVNERITNWNERVLNKDIPFNGDVIQSETFNFIKQQEYRKLADFIKHNVQKGESSDNTLSNIEERVKKIVDIGDDEDMGISVLDDIQSALKVEFRSPIPTGIDGVDAVTNGGLGKGEFGMILAPLGVGKAQPISTPVLTPNGWVKMGEIKPNDLVIGSDGKPQKVINIYPQGKRPIYKISFSDNTSTYCDEEHLWSVNSLNQRKSKTKVDGKTISIPDNTFQVLKTSEMIGNLKINGLRNYRLPNVKPVEFTEKDVLIEPYFLGLLLGGRKTLEKYRLYGALSETKFIPNDYLYNSIKVRTELLQGLLDSDGTISKNGIIQYNTVSSELSKNIRELVLSLGGTCKTRIKKTSYKKDGQKVNCKNSYVSTISFPDNGINPFKLPYKIERFKPRNKYKFNKFIESIEYSHDEDAQCILVENDDHLYVTQDFILTHNTTILTKIANTAYNNGKKVLQIVFEDTVDQVRRKHFAIWTKTKLSDMKHEDILKKVEDGVYKWHDNPNNNPGELYIARLSQENTTIMSIRRLIDRYYKKFGIKFDILVLDYLDCVASHKRTNDTLEAELVVAKSFEAMANEYNIPCWTAIQGNRSSIDKDVVTTSQSGGNIKRAQKAHFVMSIAKTQDQKLIGQANLAILKARMVQDGHVFKDSIFNNDTMEIRVTDDLSEYKNRIESTREEAMKEHDYKELTESFLKANNHENEYTYQDEEEDKQKIVSKKEYKYEPSDNIKNSDTLDYEESEFIQKSFDIQDSSDDDIDLEELEKKYGG